MIQTEKLQLVIGVPKAPNDPLSAEQGIQTYPLILPQANTGLTLDPVNLWQPGRPALKGGGQWNNSALVDGRTLNNDVVDNVTETIQLIATAHDMKGLSSLLAALQRFIIRARQFTATQWQIEPVYLEWAALGGYGSQYALIYDVQLSVSYDQPGTPQGARVTLVIEREPAWRGIPPGVSPRLWTKYWNDQIPGKDFNYTNIGFDDSGALFEATVRNRTEFTDATDNYDYPSTSKNWVELDGSKIPGDAPALACVTIDTTQYSTTTPQNMRFYVALSSKPHELPERGDTTRNRQRVYQLNFTDAEDVSGGFTTTTDNTDGVKEASGANNRTENDTTGGIMIFPSRSAGYRLSYGMQRGTYMLFCRAKYVSGTPGDTTFTSILIYTPDGRIELEPVSHNFSSTNPDAAYLGQFTIPLQGNAVQSTDGVGQLINSNTQLSSAIEMMFVIDITNTSLATAFIDLTMFPIDECVALLKLGNTDTSSGSSTMDVNAVTMDSTGYATRGNGTGYLITGSNTPTPNELTGTDLLLQPGVDNYLILFVDDLVSGITRDEYPVKVDIVPRWYGVRDA